MNNILCYTKCLVWFKSQSGPVFCGLAFVPSSEATATAWQRNCQDCNHGFSLKWLQLGNSKGWGNPWGLGARVLRGRGGGCQLLTPQLLCQNPWHPCDPWADIPPYTSSRTIIIIISGNSTLTNDNATISLPTTTITVTDIDHMTTTHNNNNWHQQEQ